MHNTVVRDSTFNNAEVTSLKLTLSREQWEKIYYVLSHRKTSTTETFVHLSYWSEEEPGESNVTYKISFLIYKCGE